ncbi:MAG: ComF family protein [Candidatus Obscuribacterales bacterium]|nr:ComF family protein [Candidatus Obscuribacterales bacterium]
MTRALALLDRCLFIESCRQCRKFISTSTTHEAQTLCSSCWLTLTQIKPLVEYCSLYPNIPILVASAAPYEGIIKQLIHRLKYNNDRLVSCDLSILLLKSLNLLEREFDITESTLIPIPLSFWREFKRGYNQAELLAKWVARHSKLPVQNKLLKRKKHTKAQHTLTRFQRISNLAGAFSVVPQKKQINRVILVDDVFTSGATLAEAARAIKNFGIDNIAAITVAQAILK